MLFRPLADPIPPVLQGVGLKCLMALEGLNGYDQLEIASRHVVGILHTYRSVFTSSQERRLDFNALCDDLVEWLEAEIAPLRFTRAN